MRVVFKETSASALVSVQQTAGPSRFPSRDPYNSRGMQALRWWGAGPPLGHPKVGTNQTSGSVFKKALPRYEQRASREPPEYVPSSGWQRPFVGDILSVFQGRLRVASEGGGMCRGWGSCLLRLPSFPVLPLYIFQLPRGLHLGKRHLHLFFSHVQVKVLLPVLADVRA